MPKDARKLLYGEVARGRLSRFLETHSDLVTVEFAATLIDDFKRAVEYGELTSAALSVQASAEILDRIGRHKQALAVQIDLFRLQLQTAGSVEEYTLLRQSALTVGARAQDREWSAAQAECWLIAAECLRCVARIGKPDKSADLLVMALRDLADIAELMSRQVPDQRWRENLARLAQMLASVSDEAYARQWEESTLLSLRSLLRRAAIAAERIIPKGLTKEIYTDSDDAREAELRLLRLFEEIDA